MQTNDYINICEVKSSKLSSNFSSFHSSSSSTSTTIEDHQLEKEEDDNDDNQCLRIDETLPIFQILPICKTK